MARTLVGKEGLGLLLMMLASVSVLATVPYSLVSPDNSAWHLSVLFCGSLLVCLPSLLVFLQFLGSQTGWLRDLITTLVISATAALFTLGFAPILWFIDFTSESVSGTIVTVARISGLLLSISLALGIVQMMRVATSNSGVRRGAASYLTMIVWVLLLIFIVWRMAGVLGMHA